jgi:hypothetical protein
MTPARDATIPVTAGGGRAIKVVNTKMPREDSLMSKTFALAAGAVALCAMTGTSNAQVQMQRDITWKLGLAIAQGAIEECAKSNRHHRRSGRPRRPRARLHRIGQSVPA